MNKKTLILIIAIAFLLLLAVIALLFSPNSKGTTPDTNQSYQKSFEEVSKNNSYYETREKVAILITKLPYDGKDFTLEYSYANNQFTLSLTKGREAAGNEELTQYLQKNDINDKNLLDNLNTEIK